MKFGENVKDQRITQREWTPLDIKIALQQQGSCVRKPSCSLSLHIQCLKNYPEV